MSATAGNDLLESLSPHLRGEMTAMGKMYDLPIRSMLHEQNEMPRYAYFMCSGLASVVVTMPEGGSAEVGVIGREGLVGAMHLIGPTPLPAQCFIQMEATALRVKMEDLRHVFQRSEEMRRRVMEFVQQQVVTSEQLTACNKLHDAESRLARWLLMTRDRADRETLMITQEFLAEMLGTRRTTVTLVAGSLQRRGLIDYKRGKVTIVDRSALETAACDCYRVIRASEERLYPALERAG